MDFILLSIHCHKLRNFATNYLDIEKPASQTSDFFQVTCFACELFVVARISACLFVLYFSKYYLLLYGHCDLRSILKAKDELFFALALPFGHGDLFCCAQKHTLVEGGQKIITAFS